MVECNGLVNRSPDQFRRIVCSPFMEIPYKVACFGTDPVWSTFSSVHIPGARISKRMPSMFAANYPRLFRDQDHSHYEIQRKQTSSHDVYAK